MAAICLRLIGYRGYVLKKYRFPAIESGSSLLQLSSHDYYTFTHCLNVAVFSVGLWQTIYPTRQNCLREFALGCILHDIGKSRIDDAILNKPGKLTDDEFAAKIAAIADVYDALTTKRSEARDPFKAVLTMKEEMVGHFAQDKFISFRASCKMNIYSDRLKISCAASSW
jgi:HD-GYP domain-containing protein (c-di-GMP phosphodiesterase class II)